MGFQSNRLVYFTRNAFGAAALLLCANGFAQQRVEFAGDGIQNPPSFNRGLGIHAAFDPEHVVVRLRATVDVARRGAIDSAIAAKETIYESKLVPGLRCVRVAPGTVDRAIATLSANPDVLYAHRDYYAHACAQGVPYGITNVHAPSAWSRTEGGGTIVAVLDTGYDIGNPDLPTPLASASFIAGEGVQDGFGHGTHVAGTILAADDSYGVVGVAPQASIIVGKVLGNDGFGPWSSISAGIDWAVANGAKVINMSLGGTDFDQGLNDSCDAARASGVLVIAAAGNDGANEAFYPANLGSVLAIAAIDSGNTRASFSNFGPHTFVCAPGVNVDSDFPGGTATWNSVTRSTTNLQGTAIGTASGQSIYCGLGASAVEFPPTVAGNIAHVSRGQVNFAVKVQNAIAAGAIGVVIGNNVAGTFVGTLNGETTVPVVMITKQDNEDLIARDATGGYPISISSQGSHFVATLSGTSMACPHVSGVAALLFSLHPATNPNMVTSAIRMSASDLGTPGFDDFYGFGAVDAWSAVNRMDLERGCLPWKQQFVTTPPPRTGSALAFDSARGETVLFGGGGAGGDLGDTWVWNGSSWSSRQEPGPSPRSQFAMAFDSARGVTVLFGGWNGSAFNGETWEWDGNNWTQRAVAGPSPRYYHSMVYDASRGVTVLFGGATYDGSYHYNSETWEWDGTAWTQRSNIGPSPRAAYGLAYDSIRHVTVLFGGTNASTGITSGDTWEWDGTTWTQRFVNSPSPRYSQAMVYDEVRGVTVLFGGSNGTDNSETWDWDGITWKQSTNIGPAARQRHALAYDSARGVCVLFGGNSPSISNDTWLLDLGQISQPIIDSQPSPVAACTAASASFAVVPRGPGPYTYQWRFGGTPIDPSSNPSATTSTLEIPLATSSTIGSYDCVIFTTNDCSTTVSAAASLTVPCPVDLNCDQIVEDGDFVIFAGAYDLLDCADPSMAPGCPTDLNGDGIVEDADFVIFATAYNELICP